MSARDDILNRVRAAHRAAPPDPLTYEQIERHYRTSGHLGGPALVERLIDRLVDYRALVRQCDVSNLPTTVAAALTERGVHRLVVPAGLLPAWTAEAAAAVAVDGGGDRTGDGDRHLPVADLDRCDGVLTACAVAIAETGTLVLDGSADQGRRAISLIPDYHLCVVRADQIVSDVPEALHRLDPVRPLTMISGPSATSDIELNRVEGVHGPRTLEVVIVAGGEGAGR